MDLQEQHGVDLRRYDHERAVTLRSQAKSDCGIPLDFMAKEMVDNRMYPQSERLDNTPEEISTYLVIGSTKKDFLVPLLVSYVTKATK